MKSPFIFLLAAVLCIFLNTFKIFQVPVILIVFLFVIWAFLSYWKVHKENKMRNTPSPVYLTNPQ